MGYVHKTTLQQRDTSDLSVLVVLRKSDWSLSVRLSGGGSKSRESRHRETGSQNRVAAWMGLWDLRHGRRLSSEGGTTDRNPAVLGSGASSGLSQIFITMSIGALITVLAVAHVEIFAFLRLVVSLRSLVLATIMRSAVSTLAMTSSGTLVATTSAAIRAIVLVWLESPRSAMLLISWVSYVILSLRRHGLTHLLSSFSLNFGRNRLLKILLLVLYYLIGLP